MLVAEIDAATSEVEAIEDELRDLMLPTDPHDGNAHILIRSYNAVTLAPNGGAYTCTFTRTVAGDASGPLESPRSVVRSLWPSAMLRASSGVISAISVTGSRPK